MAHLELYHHFSNPPSSNYFFCLATPEMADAMKNSALEHAVHVPYLMHQLLAISARDKSRRAADGDKKASYLQLAVQLQNHALALFDASNPGPLPSPLPTGSRQSTPTLAFRGSLQDFLLRWLEYVRLHRSASTHALAAAHSSSELRPLLANGRAMVERQPAGHETDALLARVAALKGLSPEVLAACLTAVDLLQVAIDLGNADAPPGSSSSSADGVSSISSNSGSTTTADTNSTSPPVSSSPEHLPIWWALSVPGAFLDALAAGLPDLVAVLAYYAVLLHRARSCWAVGPAAGTRLLQVLTAHLGLKYTEVLAFPRRELGLGHFGAVYEAGLVDWPGRSAI
ncbi:hypothetical protein KVR01_012656 [Diaporthe batatas]|uniref:uncharacterized protein n=1 Tax=Diaporthe batatas TaxID=748121 RepID=UPI001D054253|nr:uncharacterized protein KVR01_012656 [Diaporthe batatas]KAG8157614.1 hypothetical protein KVR01_012656 [Diaporthe batatas]